MRQGAFFLSLACVALMIGCKPAWSLKENKKEVLPVKDIAQDSGMLSLARPYKDQLVEKMEEVIGEAADDLEVGIPQGKLGNFAADELLAFARENVDSAIDFSLINNGGLRTPIRKGKITIGNIYELMPFDNELVILSLRGSTLDSLIGSIVARFLNQHDVKSVFPMAGISVTMDKTGKYFPEIRGEGIDPLKIYKLATSDYLAGGGDQLSILKSALSLRQSGYFLRDIFIRRIRERRGPVDAATDLRFIMAY